MATMGRELKSDRLSLRVSERQHEFISEAAETDHKDVSAFVLDAVMLRAERVLADRRVFAVSKDRWEAFNAALDRPAIIPADKPRLSKLLNTPSVLEQS